ncbi:3-oxoacyl-[acyl-carrier-protein] reductase [Aureliella helgolandensis]|uniref:3-oxoacyl-[acyl-carrier-protein] reductase n=1 Tax=Aureliella helgolandensis TaxID=2527968 RepID=A0A518GG01_9BACT|nr:3-oxoacyl-[acyl-carrier-protein] reductase [Aureliella helgolandensis]QDV27524.1 3-oxoacyl-[acyl-carrier-protein] reductase FabG [Aureliella helgolandensis]
MSDSKQLGLSTDLSGQIAMVTGASQGLGKACAERLAGCGATVICVARNAAKLGDTVSAIESAGGQAVALPCDVGSRESVQALFAEVDSKYGKLDILVNNAGITRDTLLPRMTDEQWDDVIQTNLTSCFLFCREASKMMMSARYGRIINMSSVSGLIGNPGQTNYSASKAGMIGLTRSLARELGKRKITINAVAPGFIASDMTDALGDDMLKEVKKRIPANRLGQADDVAAAVVFLASAGASYITGQVLTVDGGMTC